MDTNQLKELAQLYKDNREFITNEETAKMARRSIKRMQRSPRNIERFGIWNKATLDTNDPGRQSEPHRGNRCHLRFLRRINGQPKSPATWVTVRELIEKIKGPF